MTSSDCPAFADKVYPFSKLPEEKKGAAGKCPAFKGGCPFKECKTVGEFEANLGQMRDQCKGDAAYVQFLGETESRRSPWELPAPSSKLRVAARLPKVPVESHYFLQTTSRYVNLKV